MPTYSNKDYLRIIRPLPEYVQRDSFGIPVIEAIKIDISTMNNGLWLINMKNVSKKDTLSSKKIVHSFCYDDTLNSAYNNPIKYLVRVGSYYAVSSFDFTMDLKMDFVTILDAVYKNRWSGAFMQTQGKLVIPTIGWLKPDTYDLCFSGVRDGGTFLISSLSVNNTISYDDFIHGYYELRLRFPNTQIICLGDRLPGMDDDVCYVLYEESFGNENMRSDIWQPRLFNWNYLNSKGV